MSQPNYKLKLLAVVLLMFSLYAAISATYNRLNTHIYTQLYDMFEMYALGYWKNSLATDTTPLDQTHSLIVVCVYVSVRVCV